MKREKCHFIAKAKSNTNSIRVTKLLKGLGLTKSYYYRRNEVQLQEAKDLKASFEAWTDAIIKMSVNNQKIEIFKSQITNLKNS